jgi:hypothetical protein
LYLLPTIIKVIKKYKIGQACSTHRRYDEYKSCSENLKEKNQQASMGGIILTGS